MAITYLNTCEVSPGGAWSVQTGIGLAGSIGMTGDGNANGFSSLSLPVGTNYVEWQVWNTGSEWVGFKLRSSGSGAGFNDNGQGILLRANGSLDPTWNGAVGINRSLGAVNTRGLKKRIGLLLGAGNTLDLYVNGVYDQTITYTTSSGSLAYFGAYNGSAGYIDTIIMSETVADVNTWYQNQLNKTNYQNIVLQDNPTLFLPLNDPIGAVTSAPAIENSAGGIYFGSPTLGVSGPVPVGATSVDFNTSSQYVSASGPNFNADVFTIEAWVMFDTAAGSAEVPVANATLSEPGWAFVRDNTGIFWRLYNTGGTPYLDSSTSVGTVPENVWHHLVGVYTGTSVSLYINGILQSTGTTISGTRRINSGNSLTLGRFYSNSTNLPSNCKISSAAFYNYIMSPQQVYAHYIANLPGFNYNPIDPGESPTEVGFTPRDIKGLSVWFDASDLSTLTLSGNVVVNWRDKVKGIVAEQTTVAYRPIHVMDAFAPGVHSVRFDGTNDSLQFLTPSGLFANDKKTIIARRIGRSGGAYNFVVSTRQNYNSIDRSTAGYLFLTDADEGSPGRFFYALTGAGSATSNQTFTNGVDEVVGVRTSNSGTHVRFYRSSTDTFTNSFTPGGATNDNPGYTGIGEQGGTGGGAAFDLAEILFFDRELTDAEILQVVSYLEQ